MPLIKPEQCVLIASLHVLPTRKLKKGVKRYVVRERPTRIGFQNEERHMLRWATPFATENWFLGRSVLCPSAHTSQKPITPTTTARLMWCGCVRPTTNKPTHL